MHVCVHIYVYIARRAGRAIALFTCGGREGKNDEGRMEGKQARFSISTRFERVGVDSGNGGSEDGYFVVEIFVIPIFQYQRPR